MIHGYSDKSEIAPRLFVGNQLAARDFPGTIICVTQRRPEEEPEKSIMLPLLTPRSGVPTDIDFEQSALTDWEATLENLDAIAAAVWDAQANLGNVLVHCTPPGTMVGAAIPTQIERTPMCVIGSDGREHRVAESIEHSYSGELINIVARGIPPLRATPEHRFLVHRPYRSSSGLAFKPTWKRPRTSSAYLGIERHERTQPEWVEAADLRPDDALLSPYWQPEPNQIIALPFTPRIEHPNSRPITIPPLDADIAWLCGFYAGDGSTLGKNSLGLTLSPYDDLKRVVSTLERFGRPVVVQSHGTFTTLRVNSRTLSAQFAEWFGHSSSEKHLPDWLMRSAFRFSALEGLVAADGCARPDRSSFSLSSTSSVMAWQAWYLISSQGHRPTLGLRRRLNGYPNAQPIWEVRWTVGGYHSRTFHWCGYYALPVVSTSRASYDGPVHTLSVPDGEAYLTNGVISHNCTAGIERSPLAVAWFMFRMWAFPFDKAYQIVMQRRSIVLDRRAWLSRAARALAIPSNAYEDDA